MTFSIQPTPTPLKTPGVTKYFFVAARHPTKVPLKIEQLQKGDLQYFDNFIQPN